MEALKANSNSNKAVNSPRIHDALDDSDEGDLKNLLDQIESIQAPTLKPTQKPSNMIGETHRRPTQIAPTFDAQMTPSSSSDLFDDMEDVDALQIERPILNMPSAAAPPVPSFNATIQTNERPHIGVSSFAMGTVPQAAPPASTANSLLHQVVQAPAASVSSLLFPIAQDAFTVEAFLANIQALTIENIEKRVPLAAIPPMDKFSKVPLVVGIVTKVDQPIGRDYLITLCDDSGSYNVTAHEQIFRESRLRPHYGMLLALADCSIFRPAAKTQCLIAVQRNVKLMLANRFSIE